MTTIGLTRAPLLLSWCQAWAWMPFLLLLVCLRLGDPLSCATHCHTWVWASSDSALYPYESQDFVEVHGDLRAAFRATPHQFPCIDALHGAPAIPHAPAFANAFEFWFLCISIAVILLMLLLHQGFLQTHDRISWLAVQPPLRPPIFAIASA